MYFIKKCALLLLIIAYIPMAAAQSVQIQGLQRISKDTVLNYLPANMGDTSAVIRNLYDTGFFEDVAVSRQGSALIIKVVERPTIGSIKTSGNKDIDKDKLASVMKEVGLVEGDVFDPATLEKLRRSLETEYYNRGRYNATVTTQVIPEARHRVAVKINVSEGRIAQIKQINIIGNNAFKTKDLVKALPLSTTHFLSFFKHDDQYSEQKLEAAVEALRGYYLDRGYLKFKVDSTQASLSPDKKSIYVTIRVTEGEKYTIKGFKLTGNLILPEAVLRKRIVLPAGSVFSRKAVIKADKAISRALGRKGYMFTQVNTVPDIDETTRQVFLTFHVDPGQRVYVRRITFSGNTRTADEVLRRETRQMEGALASTTNIKQTERRLNILGYLQNVKTQTKPVPDSSDQVDLNYQVTEAPSGAARFGLGYGTNGVVVNASLDQKNFMGTGKEVRISFDNNNFRRIYNFTYNNPYYTINGVQRGFSVYLEEYTPGRLNVTNYTFNTAGGNVFYVVPISSKDDSINFGYGFQHVNLNVGSSPSIEIRQFLNANNQATQFNQVLLNGGWRRYGLDRAIFPRKGLDQRLGLQVSVPVGSSTLKYYKTNYNAQFYQPLGKSFVLTMSGGLGYGAGYGGQTDLPFFQNYFAGGIGNLGAVRGYDTNTLGPRDSNGRAIGGNFLAVASVGIIFPNFISPDNLRTTAFIDAGNVYNTKYWQNPASPQSRGPGPIRYSAGIGVEWRIPVLGLLNFSVARALNAQPGDREQFFQFSFGRNF